MWKKKIQNTFIFFFSSKTTEVVLSFLKWIMFISYMLDNQL